jgi:CheY-like chemotaxis protein
MESMPASNTLYANLKEIFNAANHSKEITRQLLAFARQQTISPQILDLNTTVESMFKMLRRLIGENIELIWKPENGECTVNMDPSQINQILANLCVNARDAIANVGKIVIETRLVNIEQAFCASNPGFMPGSFVKLSVKDTGHGIDKQTKSKLFEPFFTTKEVGKGTGLGLATVYGIVNQNHGFIDVNSVPGQGAKFDIYLPFYYHAVRREPGESAPSVPEGKGEIVLIVEDELSLLKISRIMLEKLNYRVLTAASPQEGIRMAREYDGQISLLLTDVIMPEMSGRELADELLQLNPNLKILFMSGYTADVIAHQEILEAGVQFLQKPFQISDLALKMYQALHNN